MNEVQIRCKIFNNGNDFLKECEKEKTLSSCAIIDVDIPFDVEDERVRKLTYIRPKAKCLELFSEMKGKNINLPVIFTSNHPDTETTSAGFRMGALDFMDIPLLPENIVSRIIEALKIDKFNISEVVKFKDMIKPLETLTDREYDILKEIAKGFSHKKIAKLLNISFRTVEAHTSRIKLKTQMPLPELTSTFIYSNYSR